MLTIFTIPKPFVGHINIIQRNAIRSWLALCPECEIILFGDDDGVKETAAEFGVVNVPEVEKNEFGTPLLNTSFNLVQKIAKNDILVYINSDIILMSDFLRAIQQKIAPPFLVVGRRWDLNISSEIDFSDQKWEKDLRQRLSERGKLHGFSGIDYFVFPKGLFYNLPPFAVGRIGWDNWLIYRLKSLKIPVIDATEVITAIHQNHDYSHSPYGEKKKVGGVEAKRNLELAGGISYGCTIRDTDFLLTKQGLKKPKFPRCIFSKLSLFYPWKRLLGLKRKIELLYE